MATRTRGRRELKPRYVDVTAQDGPAAPHQDQVRAFEELGYRGIALVRIEVESGGLEALVADYAPEHRAEMLEHLPAPHTLLCSADGLVLARIGWFWSWPGLELYTFMSDGARVETQRRWDEVPPWPAKRRSLHGFATVEGEMTRDAARGRSVAVVDGAGADRLDEAHRAHVAAYAEVHGCTPVPAPTAIDQVIATSEHATEHAWAVARTYARVVNGVLFGLVLAWILALVFVLDDPAAPWWALALVGVSVPVLALGPLGRFTVRFAYTRWWRPAYKPLRT